ncbi:unnamed protein product [Gongylonema pulchrum]|uniref:DUF5641 domain-containing protein n=1 Tax=Gongylonema pulchrum TaxID=637853 RepID=A0A183EEP4_9BILA|nr:unnamed protein product [Gongylonema pulchrum]
MNEIVIVCEINVPRGLWKLGKIVEVKRGSDEAIRKATVQLPNGHLWTRPISCLARLEVPAQSDREATNDTTKHQFRSKNPNLDREKSEVVSDNSSEKANKNHDVTVVMNEIANTNCMRGPKKWNPKFGAFCAAVCCFMMSVNADRKFQLCVPRRTGFLVSLPNQLHCTLSPDDKV